MAIAIVYGMPTTVQISDDTLRRLKETKEETGAKSYDDLIRSLLRRTRDRKSRFGAHPAMKPFTHGRTGHGD